MQAGPAPPWDSAMHHEHGYSLDLVGPFLSHAGLFLSVLSSVVAVSVSDGNEICVTFLQAQSAVDRLINGRRWTCVVLLRDELHERCSVMPESGVQSGRPRSITFPKLYCRTTPATAFRYDIYNVCEAVQLLLCSNNEHRRRNLQLTTLQPRSAPADSFPYYSEDVVDNPRQQLPQPALRKDIRSAVDSFRPAFALHTTPFCDLIGTGPSRRNAGQ